jgi:hypothetical protein
VTLPNVETFTNYTFDGCTNLKTVTLPKVKSFATNAFNNCTSLVSVSLPAESFTTYAFSGCTNLTTVDLPNVTKFTTYAFNNCTSLVSVSLPNVESFTTYAFSGCTSLTTVNLPNILSFTTNAFDKTGAASLAITMGATAPTVGNNAFSTVSDAKAVTVKVPSGAAGYGTVPGSYTGDDATVAWGNGFRGKGWTAAGAFGTGSTSVLKANISLSIATIVP